MYKFGRFGAKVTWLPSHTPEHLRRLHDPGKPVQDAETCLTVSKNMTTAELEELRSTRGWVRTWSEFNRAVLRTPSPSLPKWHVLEGSLADEALPTDKEWGSASGGLDAWAKWGILPGANSPDNQWVQQLRHWIAKRQPYVNGWDRAFYFATPEPAREVYAVASFNERSRILAFDTNGAFSYAVAHQVVPDPAKLHYVGASEVANAWLDKNLAGVYRVRITVRPETPSWWHTHHPLMHRLSKTMKPVLWPDGPVETFIHTCERDAWLKLVDVEPLDGVVAPSIKHALSSTAKSLWQQRQRACSPSEKGSIKWLLSRLHTASVPTRHKRVSEDEAKTWWANLGCESWLAEDFIPDIDHVSCQWSSAATVSAWARGHWLRFMTAVMQACPSAQPAYTNVDSLHVIMPEQDVDATLAALQRNNLVGAEWGQWRIQAIASRAVWLGLGKYWLVDTANCLVLHQNLGSRNPWSTGRRWCRPMTQGKNRNVVLTKISQTVWDTLNDHAHLCKAGSGLWIYRRPTLDLVHDPESYHQHVLEQLVFYRNKKKRFWYLLKNSVLKSTPM